MRHHHKPIQPTFDELLTKARDLPDGYRGHILDGALHICEPPCAARAHTLAEILAMLVAGSPLGDPVPDAWTFHSHVELAVREEGLITADIAGFQMNEEQLAREATPIRTAPGWVCEVLGDTARGFTRAAKRRTYGEMGVPYLWLADPEARVLEVFQNQRGKWLLLTTLSEEPKASAPPFEHLHFDANDLWIPVPPTKIPSPSTPPPKKH